MTLLKSLDLSMLKRLVGEEIGKQVNINTQQLTWRSVEYQVALGVATVSSPTYKVLSWGEYERSG